MTLPVGLQTVTVTDTRRHPDGTPVTGRLVLRPEVPVVSIPGHDLIVMGDSSARWIDGTATLTVLAADADGINPAGWTYRVYEYPDDGQPRDYPVLLTTALGGAVDLADLAPVEPSTGEYVIVTGGGSNLVTSVNGKQGVIVLNAADVAADASGTAATAQTAATSAAATDATTKVTAHRDATDPHGDRAAAATDATAKVSTHAAAIDPHGDRAYTDTQTATRAPATRQISAGTGLTGGGTLAADRSLAVSFGTSASTACVGNDSRLSDARTPTAHKTSHATGGSDPLTAADIGAYAATDGTVLEQLRPDLPSDQNLLAWTYDPNQAGHVTAQSNAGVAGRITLVRLIIRKQITWSNIWAGLSGIDAAAVLANCYLGVYDAAGTLKGATADISASLMTSPIAKPFALAAPFTAAPGTYFIAMLLNGTWATNSLTFKASGAGVSVNAGLAAPNLRYSNMLTAQTSLPSTLTLSGQTTTIITTGWGSQWYGVS